MNKRKHSRLFFEQKPGEWLTNDFEAPGRIAIACEFDYEVDSVIDAAENPYKVGPGAWAGMAACRDI
ncbi:hypothetical protein ACTMTI_09780 [Nonomuraea sp. H19]|uniref:hypothetical protein n=1 Tax=Nonomuraea sp. H19 TaxID=3452206 RepID=UPI003F892B45